MSARHLVEILHLQIAALEREARWVLNQLATENERGYSAGAMPIIWLESDAETLRELAARMDVKREKLTRESEHVVESR